jgi:hypothetical protein
MLENLISPDSQRELVSLLVPVKKRLADPALFDKPIERRFNHDYKAKQQCYPKH